MRREELIAALRRAKILEALRALPAAGGGARGVRARARAWAEAALATLRRHPDAVIATVVAAGVVAMIIHWR